MSSIKVNSISSFTGTEIAITGSLIINGSPAATDSSTVASASFATTAVSASYLSPITDSYIILTQVSQSLNFADDNAAALGGVPLGGLYRSGSVVLIRVGGEASAVDYLVTEDNNQLITENGNSIILE